MRKLATSVALAFFAVLALAGTAFAQAPMTFSGDLNELNGSGASANVDMTLDGDQLTVTIEGSGFAPGQPHAQHIHGNLDGSSACPSPDADMDGDGLISTAEGVPSYGGIQQSLTTEGDTSADSGLAVPRFPVADDSGDLSYSRTFTVPTEVADQLASLHVVVHGIDLNDSGAYDGDAPSSLDPSLPLEATIPAVCGTLASLPSGGVATGGGGTADTGSAPMAWLFGAVVVAGIAGTTAFRRVKA